MDAAQGRFGFEGNHRSFRASGAAVSGEPAIRPSRTPVRNSRHGGA